MASFRVGDHVEVHGLQVQCHLNGSVCCLESHLTEAERWRGRLHGTDRLLSVHYKNLRKIVSIADAVKDVLDKCSREMPKTMIQQLDVALLKMCAHWGQACVNAPGTRALLENPCRQRQRLLYEWGKIPAYPRQCINLALAPTLVYACVLAKLHPAEEGSLTIHCIGATDDFEMRADWSNLTELFRAAGRQPPQEVDIILVGEDASFNLAPFVQVFESVNPPPLPQNVKVRRVRQLYHEAGLPQPHVAMLCHPGFEVYQDWYPTMAKLIDENIPTIATAHSNFYAFSDDAPALETEVRAFGARLLHKVVWNPHCHAFNDPTKGSALTSPEKEHVHSTMSCVAVFCGGATNTRKEVEAILERMNYLSLAVTAFIPQLAKGAPHRTTSLNKMFPRMPDKERSSAMMLLRDINSQALRVTSDADLAEYFVQYGI